MGTDREVEVEELVARRKVRGERSELLRHQPLYVRVQANAGPPAALDARAESGVLERQRCRREPTIQRGAAVGAGLEPPQRVFECRPANRRQAGQIDEATGRGLDDGRLNVELGYRAQVDVELVPEPPAHRRVRARVARFVAVTDERREDRQGPDNTRAAS